MNTETTKKPCTVNEIMESIEAIFGPEASPKCEGYHNYIKTKVHADGVMRMTSWRS